ncbi:hypothetical protein [Desulfomarina sp.]
MSQIDSRPCSDSLQMLFERSIDYYCRIEAVYEKMGSGPLDSMLNFTETAIGELSDLFSNVEKVDDQIKTLMNDSSVPLTKKTSSLFKLRKRLLERIYDGNRFLHGRAMNVQSLLQHELNKMNTGHIAMRGYKSLSSENKGILAGSV